MLSKELKNNNTYARFLQDELLDKLKEICSELNMNDYVVHFKKGKKWHQDKFKIIYNP